MQKYHKFLQNFLDSQSFLPALKNYHIKVVKGDGSQRKIFRVICEDKTFILVDSEDKEENQRFIKLSSFLKAQKLNVPQIYHWDSCGTFFLQQDLGEKNFAQQILERQTRIQNQYRQNSACQLFLGLPRSIFGAYQKIIEALVEFHDKGATALKQANIKLLLTDCFRKDLAYFQDYFLKHFDSENRFSKKCQSELARLELSLKKICKLNLLGFVSRDFQARNIIFYKQEPYFIDYQDAVCGSIFYDLASLLFASHSGLNSEARFSLIEWALQNIATKKIILEDFFLFVFVRRLRSLATYTKLGTIGGNKGFQNHFQRTFSELLEINKKYNAFRKFPSIMEMVEFYQTKTLIQQ